MSTRNVEIAALSNRVQGSVLTPSDRPYATESAGFDLTDVQRPAVVVGAAGLDDVVAAVRFAGASELPVGVIATGHGVTAPADAGVLISTRRLRSVEIDAERRIARVQPGVVWGSVVDAAARHGLVPLCGSAPGVGVVGYTLGGGIGVLGRAFGFAADHVERVAIVTADGEPRDLTAEAEPDLFWAVRGGGGNFGVVTELDVGLMPLDRLYGGNLFFRGADAAAVLTAFAAGAAAAPDQLSLSVALITFPDLPALPPPLRGRFLAQVRVSCVAGRDVAESVIGPLRDAAVVVLDTVRDMPFTDVGTIHNDPPGPMPTDAGGVVLRGFDPAAIDVILRYVDAATPFMIEVRHLGGALGRPPRVPNAVGHRTGLMNVFTSVYPPGGPEAHAGRCRLVEDLAPWSDGGSLYTFLVGADVTTDDVRAAFTRADHDRLRRIKSVWDPGNMFRFNANIRPA